METHADDAQLMRQVAAGDQGAFAQLVDRHKDALVRYLARVAGCRERAEDLAQEAFLRLYQTASRYAEMGRFLPFLYRIATNLLRSEQRREGRWRLLVPLLASGGNGHGPPPPQARLLEDETRRQVSAAIEALPLRYRVPLVLHEVEEWPYRRIAELLRCREGTVKSRIHRGRQQLKKRLAPYWNGATPRGGGS